MSESSAVEAVEALAKAQMPAKSSKTLTETEANALIDHWFHTSFPGTAIAADPANWNHLRASVDNLKSVFATAFAET